jgi:Tol biopolymer transport system component
MSARRLLCSVFVVVVGVLVFASAPAVAAPLEAPELTVESIAASTATLHAVLNPLNASGAGTYEFLYKQGKAGCAGGAKVPVPAGLMTGAKEEQEYEGISGLTGGTEYTACVRAVNTTSSPSEEATSLAVTFTTAITPETPVVISPVKAVTATSATLEGVLNPNAVGNAGAYEFVYKASATQCEGGEAFYARALGAKGEAVKDEVTLLPYTSYTVCLRAYNDAGEVSAFSAPVTFMTLPLAAVIESESSADVDATEARLQATIDPENSQASYHFEYGPAAGSYDVSTPVREIKPGLTGVGVDVVLAGLNPGATYHYRVVASNVLPGSVDGTDREFTTPVAQSSGSPTNCPNEQLRAEQPYALVLPDCRAYEMVSPVNTEGSDATDWFVGTRPRAAVSGEAVTYASRGNFAEPEGGAYEDQFVSRRGAEGWSTQAITPLHYAERGATTPSYLATAFNPELTESIALTNAPFGDKGPNREFDGLYLENFANHSYRSIVSTEVNNPLEPMGESTDLSHVVLGQGTVSEWVNGEVVPIAVANSGKSMGAANVGGPFVWRAVSADGSRVYFTSGGVLYLRENAEQPQSPTSGEECTVATDACTIDVSASQKTNGSGPKGVDPTTGSANYQGASVDGSEVFFTSKQELTNDANTGPAGKQEIIEAAEENYYVNGGDGSYTLTFKGQTTAAIQQGGAPGAVQSALEALSSIGVGNVTVSSGESGYLVTFGGALAGSEQPAISADGSGLSPHVTVSVEPVRLGRDLYEYDLETGKLTDLSVDTHDTDGAMVQGVSQISEDGSYVYFVADGVLGTGANAGEPNLYVSHDGGVPTFIATLSAKDSADWAEDAGGATNAAVVSTDGSRFAFTSEQSLTGYDNEQAEPGECENGGTGKCQEIYFYDAETSSLACASCNPSGARPRGASSFYVVEKGSDGIFSQPYYGYHFRNMAEDGTVFFNSTDALVPHASDGRENVYEYEDGHVYPISDVAGGYNSFFMDASANGDNVFFATADQLLPQDASNNVVVYDARVGGGFPVTVSSPSCDNGDSCKSPPAPQPALFGAPGSATFSGPGNIAPVTVTPAVKTKTKAVKCKKGYEKKKNKCVKKATPKKKAKKSSNRKGSK